MITLNGSHGEGGGQILRTAIGLSMVTGKPFRIENIRAGREKPGLLRQHLTAVNAAAQICSAKTDGAALGSLNLTFTPSAVRGGAYSFAIGSAGSTTLVLQTILPALLVAEQPSTITIEGGTHNSAAPPFEFLEKAFVPLLNRMGANVSLTLHRTGFFPAGGGRMTARIEPVEHLTPLHLPERGAIAHRAGHAIVAGIPGDIAKRELAVLKQQFDWPEECFRIRQLPDDEGPGNVVMIEIGSEHVTEVFTAFGARGIRAEAVADSALRETKAYLAAGVPVGPHLADQLLIPLALAGGGSFVTVPLTPHTTTNIETIQTFLDVKFAVDPQGGKNGVRISLT